jgi:hypothetical protein
MGSQGESAEAARHRIHSPHWTRWTAAPPSRCRCFWLGVCLLAAVLPAVALAAPVQYDRNGHYYDVVSRSAGITWSVANEEAAALTFNGMHGHLATITSHQENDFIVRRFPRAIAGAYWLGGFQARSILDPGAGWQWVTGEPWGYTLWNRDEPNDYYGDGTSGQDENRLHFWNQAGGAWNDLRPSDNSPLGYVVEYEPDSPSDPLTVTGYAAPESRQIAINYARPGTPLLITGTNLGTGGTVLFDGLLFPAAVTSWSPSEIQIWVPSAPSYPFPTQVTVVTDRRRAEGGSFTIAAPTPGQDNLLANGSFEYPSSSSSPHFYGYVYGQADFPSYPGFHGYTIPGWRIPWGTIDVYRTGWQQAPGQGRQSIDLVGSPYGEIIAQTFYTEPGREYVFSGWLAHDPVILRGRADVYLNDRFFVQLYHKQYTTETQMGWESFVYKFRALEEQTTLTIEDVTERSFYEGTALDGLSVTPAP